MIYQIFRRNTYSLRKFKTDFSFFSFVLLGVIFIPRSTCNARLCFIQYDEVCAHCVEMTSGIRKPGEFLRYPHLCSFTLVESDIRFFIPLTNSDLSPTQVMNVIIWMFFYSVVCSRLPCFFDSLTHTIPFGFVIGFRFFLP